MLQLRRLNRDALDAAVAASSHPLASNMLGAPLAARVDSAIAALRSARENLARQRGGMSRLLETLDRAIRTNAREHLDDPEFSEATKLEMVRALHRFNFLFRTYPRFVRILRPFVLEVARVRGRPARVLELASGSGEFAIALATEARKQKLPLEITGSDYIGRYVAAANAAARARGCDARFIALDAFDMRAIADDEYDIVFIAQSMHHFRAGDLAQMIEQSQRVASTAFVGVDGYRSLTLLALLPTSTLLAMRRPFLHDAWTSARRLFSEPELELIARLAAPRARIAVRTEVPGLSVLEVRVPPR